MQDYGHIRRMYLVDGLSQRQIAEKLGISRNTVAKYCEGNTYPGLRASYCRAASVMTPDILRFIEQCLHEDRLEPNQKQHHTAKRIYERLVEEKSFTSAQSTVRRIVAKLRGHPREAFVPLAFAPGDAMPDRSPLMSAAKTGTPALLRASAISWRVLVLPVPVAPATSPCRLNIASGMRMGASTTGAPSISTPSCTASPSNPYPA